MRWSKLKQNVESRMAPTLAGRVRLHTAHYHDAHDSEGRGWITVDGEEIVMFCEFRGRKAERKFIKEYMDAHPGVSASQVQRHAWTWAEETGSMTQSGYYNTLHRYLDMSIDDAHASPNVLIQALAMLDSRTGKRRLQKLALQKHRHPLIERLFALRCDVEGIRTPEGATSE